MRDALSRWSIRARDALRYSRSAAAILGARDLLRAWHAGNSPRRVAFLASAFRRFEQPAIRHWVQRHLLRIVSKQPALVAAAHREAFQHRGLASLLTRTTLLKSPGPAGERGVIMCQFEYNWSRLLEGVGDLGLLLDRYDVIWGTSWSPTDYLILSRVLTASEPAGAPVYVFAANLGEVAALRAFHPRIRVPELLASEFQDPGSFTLLPYSERDIDLLVVSNWAPFKRHWELFEALRKLPPELRVVCVGQPEAGYTRHDIERIYRIFRVPQRIDFRESLPLDEVRNLQGRSRAAAVFSRREGQCMAAVEALFAGASLGLRRGAQIGAAAYVNEETGILLRPGHLSTDLGELIEGADKRNPAAWAREYLGRDRATASLTAWLRDRAIERGLPWTREIVRHWWAPYPWVGNPADQDMLAPAAAGLHARFPDTFPADMLDSSRH